MSLTWLDYSQLKCVYLEMFFKYLFEFIIFDFFFLKKLEKAPQNGDNEPRAVFYRLLRPELWFENEFIFTILKRLF